jgi:hypothetical protein
MSPTSTNAREGLTIVDAGAVLRVRACERLIEGGDSVLHRIQRAELDSAGIGGENSNRAGSQIVGIGIAAGTECIIAAQSQVPGGLLLRAAGAKNCRIRAHQPKIAGVDYVVPVVGCDIGAVCVDKRASTVCVRSREGAGSQRQLREEIVIVHDIDGAGHGGSVGRGQGAYRGR